MTDEPLRIFIGTEDSQIVAHRVLEHSIRAHASIPVDVTPMLNLPLPVPSDPINRSRVGFSFTRFLIPSLAGYEGRAVYMDADMLVFGDVAELAQLPFEGNKVLCTFQRDIPAAWKDKKHFQTGRHTAVMLLDCSRLPWKADEIVGGLDEGRYTYEELVYDMCLVEPAAIADTIPTEWNHLERYEPGLTRLLHFTVVHTQPWKNDRNPLRRLWLAAFAEAVQDGAVPTAEVEAAIAAGHVAPFLGEFLQLAPDRGAQPDADEARRELVLARLEIAELVRRLDGMRASRSWRIGRAVTGAAERLQASVKAVVKKAPPGRP